MENSSIVLTKEDLKLLEDVKRTVRELSNNQLKKIVEINIDEEEDYINLSDEIMAMSEWNDIQTDAFLTYYNNSVGGFIEAFSIAQDERYDYYLDKDELLDREGVYAFNYANKTDLSEFEFGNYSFIDWDALFDYIYNNKYSLYEAEQSYGYFSFDY